MAARRKDFFIPIMIIIIAVLVFAAFQIMPVRTFLVTKYCQLKICETGFPGEILPYNGKIVQPMEFYYVGSQYGIRRDPFTHELASHSGIDLLTMEGLAVRAVKDGNIDTMDYDPNGYGNWIEIRHPDGTSTRYAHLSAFGNITIGEKVGAGSVIGAIGSTGRSTEPHLHFELRNNNSEAVDPNSLLGLKNWGNILI